MFSTNVYIVHIYNVKIPKIIFIFMHLKQRFSLDLSTICNFFLTLEVAFRRGDSVNNGFLTVRTTWKTHQKLIITFKIYDELPFSCIWSRVGHMEIFSHFSYLLSSLLKMNSTMEGRKYNSISSVCCKRSICHCFYLDIKVSEKTESCISNYIKKNWWKKVSRRRKEWWDKSSNVCMKF